MKKLFLSIFVILSLSTSAQDVIFSQNFLVPETLNSSFAGAIRSTKFGSVHKSQWRNSNFKTNSSFVFLDTWHEGYRTGIGISFLNQNETASSYTFNQVNLNLAMRFQLNEDWFFRPSVSTGFGMKSFGFQSLVLEDQINITNNLVNTSSIDPAVLGQKRNFFDFSSSLLFNNDESWFGITMRHLNRPNISLTPNGNVPLDIFMSAHGKIYLPFTENIYSWIASKSKFYLLANFMMQGNVNRFDTGIQYTFDDQFSLGLTVATSPLKNNDNPNFVNSVNTFAGWKWEGWRFGYSYDINTTDLFNTGGIHEFSISYDFNINIRALNRYKCVPYF